MAKIRTTKEHARRGVGTYLGWAAVAFAAGLVIVTTLSWSGVLNRVAASGATTARPAPGFTARLLEGGSFALAEQHGNPVLVLFTASWCSPCIPEVNKMAQLQDEFGARGLRQLVLSVDPQDTVADFASLRRRTSGSNLLWALDAGQQAALAYQIRATDTKVLVDRRGQVAYQSVGPTPFETLREQVAAVVR